MKAAELQTFVNSNELSVFLRMHESCVCGTRVNYPKQLLTLDNKTIIIEKYEVLVSWKAYLSHSSMDRQQWNNMQLSILNKGQSNTGCINA